MNSNNFVFTHSQITEHSLIISIDRKLHLLHTGPNDKFVNHEILPHHTIFNSSCIVLVLISFSTVPQCFYQSLFKYDRFVLFFLLRSLSNRIHLHVQRETTQNRSPITYAAKNRYYEATDDVMIDFVVVSSTCFAFSNLYCNDKWDEAEFVAGTFILEHQAEAGEESWHFYQTELEQYHHRHHKPLCSSKK